MCLFVESSPIVKYYNRYTNIKREIANLNIINITSSQRSQLIDEAIRVFEQQIDKDFIDYLIGQMNFDYELQFGSPRELEQYIRFSAMSQQIIIRRSFQEWFGAV
jgi:hypothetical protein